MVKLIYRYPDAAAEVDRLMSLNPFNLVMIGDFSKKHKLPFVAPADIEIYSNYCKDFAREIQTNWKYPCGEKKSNALDFAQNILRLTALENQCWIQNQPIYTRKPTILVDLFNLTEVFLYYDPTRKESIIQGFIQRFSKLERYLHQTTQRLDHPVNFWVDAEIAAGKRFNEIEQLLKTETKNVNCQIRRQLENQIHKLKYQIRQYNQKIEDLPKSNNFSIGELNTQRMLRLLGISNSPEELHKKCIDEITQMNKDIPAIKQEILKQHPTTDVLTVIDLYREPNQIKPKEKLKRNQTSTRQILRWQDLYKQKQNFFIPSKNTNSSKKIQTLQQFYSQVRLCAILSCLTGNKEYLVNGTGYKPNGLSLLDSIADYYHNNFASSKETAKTKVISVISNLHSITSVLQN